jgi:hypothetical protein
MHARLIIGTVAAAMIAAPVFAQTASDHESTPRRFQPPKHPSDRWRSPQVDKGAGKLHHSP